MSDTYRPSGNFSPAAIIFVPLVMGVVSIVLGFGYAYAAWHNPLIYIGAFLPWVYAALLSFLGGWAFRLTPVRSPRLAGFLAILGGVFGYLFHALVWLNLYLSQSESVLSLGSGRSEMSVVGSLVNWELLKIEILNLKETFGYLLEVIDEGVWSFKGTEVRGWAYRAIWIGEALLFIFTLASRTSDKAREPFSEEQGKYLSKKALPQILRVPFELGDILSRFENGDYGYVMVAEPESERKNNHLEVVLYLLEEQPTGYISVTLVTHENKKTLRRKVVEKASIPSLQAEQLLSRFGGR
ncbi:MAG: hypothetical protein LBP92_11625 [Deltaproteobacteria bacterium]|nr:hypothetical protein [Deltaproteobacteria bacterium]